MQSYSGTKSNPASTDEQRPPHITSQEHGPRLEVAPADPQSPSPALGSTHHLVQGVAQQPMLVEDEEPTLPFLQEKAAR